MTKRRHSKRKSPSRYVLPQGSESQFEPGSHGRVLRNLAGIRSKSPMDRAEYESLLSAQKKYLAIITADTRFTAALIRKMHEDWLGGIYEWAGCYRTVELEKEGFRWPPSYRVDANMQAFENGLLAAHTPCRPGTLPAVAGRVAQVHAELLLIHPFREGNGRVARWLADLMALQAGLPAPTYGFTGRGAKVRRQKYLGAVLDGYAGDYALLTAFFLEALTRRVAGEG